MKKTFVVPLPFSYQQAQIADRYVTLITNNDISNKGSENIWIKKYEENDEIFYQQTEYFVKYFLTKANLDFF